MQEYEKLKEFWDKSIEGQEAEVINEKWIYQDKWNEIIKKYINKDSKVLDYGCGSGWALIEAYNTIPFKKGIGIDTSKNMINYANLCKPSAVLDFINGDESLLNDFINEFDFVMSFNVIDVLPDEIINKIIPRIVSSLKDSSYAFIGLNPDFSEEFLIEKIQMEKKGHYFYKNGVLRANKKSIEEWEKLFLQYFEIVESFNFTVTDSEKAYPRVGFLLKK